jgi:hypothetical protein
MQSKLENLHDEMVALARLIDAPAHALPTFEGYPEQLHTFGRRMGFGHPHISELDGRFYWTVREAEGPDELRSTPIMDEMLYWIFSAATFTMAIEATGPREGDDRAELFESQLSILKSLSNNWYKKRSEEIQDVLRRYPLRKD